MAVAQVAPMAPQAWCRRTLAALIERQAEGPEAGYLELLLTCLIELDPSASTFETLLARYATDRRLGIAEAAEVLQQAWHQATARALDEATPSLRERLRVVGALLDGEGARAAVVQLSAERVRVQVADTGTQHSLGLLELRHEIAARQALRGKVVVGDPQQPDRHESRLRAVGFALEGEPAQTYELFATPRAVIVEGDAGYFHVFELAELALMLQAAMAQRRDWSTATAGTPTPLELTAELPAG